MPPEHEVYLDRVRGDVADAADVGGTVYDAVRPTRREPRCSGIAIAKINAFGSAARTDGQPIGAERRNDLPSEKTRPTGYCNVP